MGCDIHIWIETRDGEPGTRGWNIAASEALTYHSRDYQLFSWLADVRNDWGGPLYVEPLSKPRGLPTDVSAEVGRQIAAWGSDLHSHTYFTAAELFTAAWYPAPCQCFMLWVTALCATAEKHDPLIDARLRYYGTDNVRFVIAFDN